MKGIKAQCCGDLWLLKNKENNCKGALCAGLECLAKGSEDASLAMVS